MPTFVLEVWDDEGCKATLYTIRKFGAEDSETDKFFLRFENDPAYKENAQQLVSFILSVICDAQGAREHFFRFETQASALPPKPSQVRGLAFDFEEFPLRLYCLRISDELVVLMNGGIKTSSKAQDSPDIRARFSEANRFAKAIDRALKEKSIWIGANGRTFESDDDELILEC